MSGVGWGGTLRLCQRQDFGLSRKKGVHVLGRLMPGFVRGESQRERGASVEGQFDRMIEVAVQGLQDEERIIHDV